MEAPFKARLLLAYLSDFEKRYKDTDGKTPVIDPNRIRPQLGRLFTDCEQYNISQTNPGRDRRTGMKMRIAMFNLFLRSGIQFYPATARESQGNAPLGSNHTGYIFRGTQWPKIPLYFSGGAPMHRQVSGITRIRYVDLIDHLRSDPGAVEHSRKWAIKAGLQATAAELSGAGSTDDGQRLLDELTRCLHEKLNAKFPGELDMAQ